MKTINSLRSKLLALTLALMASVSTFAYDYHGDLLCYNILTDSTVAVTGQSEYKTMPRYEYLPENLVIPSEVTLQGKTYKVVSIDQWAFYACTMLKSVTIPSSVTFIGLSAFQYCENLVNVDIPTSVTTVEGSAFSYTKWYDNLPDGEVYINNTLYRYKGTAPENTQIVVKDGTTRIAGFTFWNQSNIVAIELPQTLTDIEHGAFEGCTQLSSILIPKNVTFIGASAFAECTGLKEVICLAPTPPIAGVDANPSPSDWMFAGVDVANVLLYVPMESIELYRNADQWKDFQIRVYYGSEECNEYKHVKLSVISYGNKLIYSLVTDDGSEIPDVDSVWILNTDKEPLQKFYGQSRDTIDLLFLELGTYILEVYLNECVKRKIFFVHPKMKYIWCDTWNIMWFDGWRFDETASTSQYRLGKDTIIGDYTYSKFTSRTSVRFTSDRKVYVYYEGFDDNDPYTQDLLTGEYLAYDFSAQVGDTLEIFSGIHSYTTEQCVVYDVQTDPETNLRTIMLHPLRVVDGDGNVGVSGEEITWLEGVGSPNGFLISTPPLGGGNFALLCAYQGDELKYTGSLYDEYGCEYNATEQTPEDLFPTLWGLQRTHTIEMYDYAPNDGKRNGGYPELTAPTKDTIIDGKTYLQFDEYYSSLFLREENNKVLIYSSILQNDLVLYDYTLELGDSLPAITSDHDYFSDDHFTKLDKAENIFTYVVTDVSTITLLDGMERKKWTLQNQYLGIMEYVEGIGCFGEKNSHSGDFFRLIYDHPYKTEYVGDHLVCVSKNGQLLYSMPQEEMNSFTLTCECLSQEDTIAPEDLFPTLWGLQRTTFYHYTECSDSYSSLTASNEIVTINDKPYLRFGKMFLREENNQVLIYSTAYDKDLVLYDWNLEVGDSISLLAMDYGVYPEYAVSVVDYRVIVDIDEHGDLIMDTIPTDKVVVDKISTITLLDGKEYKTWHLATGWAGGITYVEGIGILSEGYGGGDYLGLIRPEELPTCYYGDLLVCVSKNNKLLYQMDDAEMERLGAECLCDYNRGPRKDNAKDGQIGGRPTPTQWNQLEVVLRQMDNNHTILQAETFSYTLEDISQQVNNKTYFQLARQSTKDTATTKSVVGALHFGKDEDNRVYFLRDGVEYVLYDFTAEIGDTVEIFAGINNYPQETTYTHVVIDKDTTEDGACRMFLEVVFPEETTTAENAEKVWLAGLGSVDGIVHNAAKRTSNAHAAPSRSASSETESSVMLCAWREDSCLYTTNHPDYETFGCVYNQDPTAVEDISTSQSSYQKLLRDGQLFIIHDGKTYNVLGVPVE